ncbi:hypothetical protein BTN50_1788 (plasmid) [Candidatus Enterovibrio altilux]|uniref:Uncharacterized protein n=1 Tax=Candidatus Enterovibrio altilux TaxID=1927128 RepID=A0A291BB78_9GAMM|nr:hypothetical protein BTN50_1788 [Candidatus Enterovibrio luxaltus]
MLQLGELQELLGIDSVELGSLRAYELERRSVAAERRQEVYDADVALKQYCNRNVLRVFQHRHTQTKSSYSVAIVGMPALERLAYITKNIFNT